MIFHLNSHVYSKQSRLGVIEMDREMQETLVKIIVTLENDHHGCKEEAINLARIALGIEIEHNPIREMINSLDEKRVQEIISSLKV